MIFYFSVFWFQSSFTSPWPSSSRHVSAVTDIRSLCIIVTSSIVISVIPVQCTPPHVSAIAAVVVKPVIDAVKSKDENSHYPLHGIKTMIHTLDHLLKLHHLPRRRTTNQSPKMQIIPLRIAVTITEHIVVSKGVPIMVPHGVTTTVPAMEAIMVIVMDILQLPVPTQALFEWLHAIGIINGLSVRVLIPCSLPIPLRTIPVVVSLL